MRKRTKKAIRGTKKEAERELARLLQELDSGVAVGNNLSLSAFIEQWLSTYAKPKLSPKTYHSYDQLLKMHVLPVLGSVKLADLKPLHLQKLYNNLATSGRKDGKPGGLSQNSVKYIHRVMHKALDTAVKWQLVSRNVAEATELPSKDATTEMNALDEGQVDKMLTEAFPTPHFYLVFLAVMTGLRRGELYGLHWSDVDLAAGRIYVRQSLQYLPDRGVFFKSPKTAKSTRNVAISPVVVDLLKKYRHGQLEKRLAFGPGYIDHDLVFCQANGEPCHPDTITSWFPDFMEKIGLPRIRFHDLRHTHATLLLKSGVDFKVISDRLGHSGIQITLNTYAHVLPDQQAAAASKLDKFAERFGG